MSNEKLLIWGMLLLGVTAAVQKEWGIASGVITGGFALLRGVNLKGDTNEKTAADTTPPAQP